MTEAGETVTIEMTPGERLKLYGQITGQMEKSGYNPCDWTGLNLGFELPPGWPVDMNTEITLAQLIVLARKLKRRIIISNLDLVLREEPEKEKPDNERADL